MIKPMLPIPKPEIVDSIQKGKISDNLSIVNINLSTYYIVQYDFDQDIS